MGKKQQCRQHRRKEQEKAKLKKSWRNWYQQASQHNPLYMTGFLLQHCPGELLASCQAGNKAIQSSYTLFLSPISLMVSCYHFAVGQPTAVSESNWDFPLWIGRDIFSKGNMKGILKYFYPLFGNYVLRVQVEEEHLEKQLSSSVVGTNNRKKVVCSR